MTLPRIALEVAQPSRTVVRCQARLAKWAATIDVTGPFILGGALSLADVHAAPFLHRLRPAVRHATRQQARCPY